MCFSQCPWHRSSGKLFDCSVFLSDNSRLLAYSPPFMRWQYLGLSFIDRFRPLLWKNNRSRSYAQWFWKGDKKIDIDRLIQIYQFKPLSLAVYLIQYFQSSTCTLIWKHLSKFMPPSGSLHGTIIWISKSNSLGKKERFLNNVFKILLAAWTSNGQVCLRKMV